MSLLPCAVLVYIPLVCASLASLNDTSIHTLDSSACPSCNTRTLLDILLSCGITLFACTWTAVHTNIPRIDEGKVSITYFRVVFMVTAYFAPEIIITWAAEEFFSARAATKDFNAKFGAKRPKTHDGDQDTSGSTAILLSDIHGSSSPPRPAAEFKEWTMTHGFFAWMGGFMLHVNGKPRATLTPDELLQFFRDGSVDMPVISEEEIEDKSKGDGLSKGIALLQLVWFAVQFVARYVQNLPITLLETDTLAVAALTCIAYGLWWKKPKDVRCPCIIHWKAAASPSRLTYEKADPSEDFSSTHVRYRRGTRLGLHGRPYVLLIGCFSGMVYGGIHCLGGWNYMTQGQGGAIMWRVASLMTVCAPVLVCLGVGCHLRVDKKYFDSVIMILMACAVLLGILTYLVARAILVVFIVTSLESLPPGTYDTVAWSTYIPHFTI